MRFMVGCEKDFAHVAFPVIFRCGLWCGSVAIELEAYCKRAYAGYVYYVVKEYVCVWLLPRLPTAHY